jgi:hypothetical protein
MMIGTKKFNESPLDDGFLETIISAADAAAGT